MKTKRLATALTAVLVSAASLPVAAQGEPPPGPTFTIERFQVEGENPLEAGETREVLTPYTGEHDGLAGIEAASQALEAELRSRGYAFHRVIVPPQRAEAGVFTLRVLAFKLKDVQVSGNEHFDDENIRASVPALRVGEVPDNKAIARSLELANEHPAKRVAVFMKEGDTPGDLAARIETRDVRPWQVFGSLSNTGSDETGSTRLAVGVQHNNLFGRDHGLTVSYTTSPGNEGDVKQRGVHYRIPLYERHLALTLFYTDSDVAQGTIADFFDVSGSGRFKGAELAYTLSPRGKYRHKVAAGLQDKLFEDNSILSFQGQTVPIGSDVRSRPLSLRYTGRFEGEVWKTGFSVDYAHNLGSGDLNDDQDYDAVTNGFGDSSWNALHFRADAERPLPADWLFRGRLQGQYGGEVLISGEQFGLGGAASVRGFEEREVSGDNGVGLNLEAWAPPFNQNLKGLAFLDHGWLERERTVAGVKGSESVTSAGLGLRWQWQSHVNLSVDVAKVLNGAVETERYDERVHFNLFARF